MITLTVITPCYNAAKFIKECINSVQYSKNFGKFQIQHIIVDDCSTDNTLEIIKKNNYPNLQLIRQTKNTGCSTARNVGLRAATGKYIFFLDADDVLFENSLRYLLEKSELANSEWVYGDFLRGNEKLEYLPNNDYFGWKFNSPAELLTSMFSGKHFFQQNGLFLKETLQKIGGFTEKLGMAEDFDLCVRLLLNQILPVYLPGPLYMHRLHSQNASIVHIGNPDQHRKDVASIFSKYRDQVELLLTEEQTQEIGNFIKGTAV